ncbi:MAG TPA: ABC transporter substrate-binding protein [Terriglobales bacterium]|nr:ABC transporter substrate-binding protein [Terriglobales bacterium]
MLTFITAVALCVALFAIVGGVAGDGFLPAMANPSPGVSNPASARRNDFVIVCGGYEGALNPLWPQSETDAAVTRLIFDPLVEASADGTPTACLADYTRSGDGLTYTFTIKKNAAFSDGTPVTADDVAFTWEVIRDPDYDGTMDLSDVASVQVKDDGIISATLKAPRASAVFDLGVAPLSRTYYGKGYTKGQLDYVRLQSPKPMGCGQYALGTYTMESMTLSRCDDYYAGKSRYETVTFLVSDDGAALMASGEADVCLTGSAEDAPYIENRVVETDSIGLLGFNAADKTLSDPIVRGAIALCVDRQALIDAALSGLGEPLDAPVFAGSWAYGGEPSATYDPAAAAVLLTEAGYGSLALTYTVTEGNPASQALGEQLKASLEQAGITLKLERLDYGSLLRKVELGGCQLWFMGFGVAPTPNPAALVATDGEYNLFNYSNGMADLLLTEIESGTIEQRKTVCDRLWQELAENPPFVVLYQGRGEVAVNIRAAGLVFSPLRPFTAGIYQLT